jgi:glycosyltransferase involved in cell wall biosynthesis
MSARLTICVPVFNEEESIADTLGSLRKTFPEAEIQVVDDGSTDRSGEILEAVEGIVLTRNDRNRGYGASLKLAMRASAGDMVAWFDGDGQHDPEDLRRVVGPVLEGEQDAVIGIRPKGSGERSRRSGKWILRLAAEMIVRGRVPDLNSGMRCFDKGVIRRYLHLLPDGFSASATSTLLMMKRGYRLGYVEIGARKRSGQSTVRPLRDGLRTLHLLLRMLVLFEAFSFFTLLSAVQVVPGIIYGFWIAFRNMEGFPTLASTVILSGMLTFFMGLLCDQVTELRKEKFEN